MSLVKKPCKTPSFSEALLFKEQPVQMRATIWDSRMSQVATSSSIFSDEIVQNSVT